MIRSRRISEHWSALLVATATSSWVGATTRRPARGEVRDVARLNRMDDHTGSDPNTLSTSRASTRGGSAMTRHDPQTSTSASATTHVIADALERGARQAFGALPARPGKIVAVHLSYASRADQRGRRPANPSYFLKPSSSVAGSGRVVERPVGTELLAFEGEIALVLGTTARHVTTAEAWSHVAWVTAANDLG